MTNYSQNGWTVIGPSATRKWVIPMGNGSPKHFVLRRGHAGFVLAYFALYFHEKIERLNTQEQWDDWGWANRPIRGSNQTSNHASGTAMDLNATKHPLSAEGTFSNKQASLIRWKLRRMFGLIRWGGDYTYRKDEMHFEINAGTLPVRIYAKLLRATPRGRAIRRANDHYFKLD